MFGFIKSFWKTVQLRRACRKVSNQTPEQGCEVIDSSPTKGVTLLEVFEEAHDPKRQARIHLDTLINEAKQDK